MKQLSRLQPSPALVVACIALFVALGGVGYAAATGAIDSREIKNGTIKAKDIKNRAITGKKIKANAVGGGAVKESSLGKVPAAGTADNAANAGNANTVGGRPATSFEGVGETIPFSVFITGTGEKTIANVGPFRIYAACAADESGESDEVSLRIDTSQSGGAIDDNNGPEHTPFNTDDNPAVLASSSASGVNIDAEGEDTSHATANAITPDGTAVIVHSYGFGQNLRGIDDSCHAQGVINVAPPS